MILYKIRDKLLELPLGDLYVTNFEQYLTDNIISFENIKDKDELYHYTDSLFGWIARSLCLFTDDYLPDELKLEKQNIRQKISTVDRLQKFYFQKGQKEKSIALINEFVDIMLEHYKKVTQIEEPKKEV